MSDLYDQVQDQEQRMQDLEDRANNYDVSQEATDGLWEGLLNNKFNIGTTTLVGGTVTIIDGFCANSSLVFISIKGAAFVNAGVPATYGITYTNGSFTITSTQATDTSIINYFIIY